MRESTDDYLQAQCIKDCATCMQSAHFDKEQDVDFWSLYSFAMRIALKSFFLFGWLAVPSAAVTCDFPVTLLPM